MKQKWLAALLIVMLCVSLTACGNRGSIPGDNPPDIPNQEVDPEWEAEQEQKYEMEQYGIDLSMYDDHGEWSYDRMWVHKTEESWDSVKGYYGYIDRKGNLIGEWHEEKTDGNMTFTYDDFVSYRVETSPWIMPGDFQGDYAVILCAGHRTSHACLEVINAKGESIGRFVPDFTIASYNTNEALLNTYAKKLSNDMIFWDIDWNATAMAWVANGTLYTREIKDANFMSACDVKAKINGYYPHWYYYEDGTDSKSYFGLIAENGDHVLQSEMDYEVIKMVPLNNKTVRVHFIGADEREYEVVLDFDGNWLTEPERVE